MVDLLVTLAYIYCAIYFAVYIIFGDYGGSKAKKGY